MSSAASAPHGAPRASVEGTRLAGLATALVVAGALFVAWKGGVKGFGGVPPALRIGAAIVVLFGPPGYALARFALPEPLRRHLPLFVLPFGACVVALSLTVLGFAQVPLTASLVAVTAAGVVASVEAWRRGPPNRDRVSGPWLAGSLGLALVIVCVGMLPMLRAGEAGLTGSNGDAVLAVGVGEFLQDTQPAGVDEAGYVDRMPAPWRSKYPIYYALAGVSEVAGVPVEEAFPVLIAVMLGMTAVGWMLFSFHVLAAGAAGALVAMWIVGLDRILLYLTVGPFYNQMWGQFAMVFLLLLALQMVRRPTRPTVALFVLFAALGAFAYPLMLPFPIVLLGVAGTIAWRRAGSPRPRLRLPRSRARRWLLGALAVIMAPAVLVTCIGVLEKGISAALVILPGSDLSDWNALPIYLPFHSFFGLTDPVGLAGPATVGLIALAYWGLRRLPRDVALALGTMLAGALAFAVYFRIRENGAFFYFKILGFAGPMVLALAVVSLVRERADSASRAVRGACTAGLALLAVSAVVGARLEVNQQNSTFTPDTRELASWSEQIPAGDSILLALPPSGPQLNATSFLSSHPLSSPLPLGGTFPAVPQGLKADWVLTESPPPPPVRAVIRGRPRFANGTYRLYAGAPDAPGRDRSSRRAIDNAPWGQAGVPLHEPR